MPRLIQKAIPSFSAMAVTDRGFAGITTDPDLDVGVDRGIHHDGASIETVNSVQLMAESGDDCLAADSRRTVAHMACTLPTEDEQQATEVARLLTPCCRPQETANE